jgi:hypothetical protein
MNAPTWLRVGLAAAVLSLATAVPGTRTSSASFRATAYATSNTTGCEASLSVVAVTEPIIIPEIGITILPPAPGSSPDLGPDAAFYRACQEEGPPSNVVEVSFVQFGGGTRYVGSDGESTVDTPEANQLLVPAWIVSYKGACMDFGLGGNWDIPVETECDPNEEFNVVIDDAADAFIMAYGWDPTASVL